VSGYFTMYSSPSLITNVVVAAYQGTAVEALRLVGKGTNSLQIYVDGGERYYFSEAVPADAFGDVTGYGTINFPISTSRTVPGNLLREPSWEGTAILGAQYWRMAGSIGGHVGEPGGADGSTWPVLGTAARIWQDFPTIPGHAYRVKFAHAIAGCCGATAVRVSWDDREIGYAEIPE